MSLLGFWKKNSDRFAAIIDIGSATVSGALVSVCHSGRNAPTIRIHDYARSDTHIENEYSYERFMSEISRAIKQVITNLGGKGFPPPEKFVCFLSSPYVVSQTRVINYRHEAPLVFTQKILDKLTSREAERFREQSKLFAGDDGFGPDGHPDGFELIESKVMQVKLDGYEVNDPFGKTATEAMICQFVSGSSTSMLRKIRDSIMEASHLETVEFHSYAFSAFSSLRDYLGAKKSFLAVDVSGELTDILVAVDGVLTENMSFPFGLNAIIRDIALANRTIYAEAASELGLYLAGKLHEKARTRLEGVLEAVRTKWVATFSETLSTILDSSVVPEHIILTGDTKASPIFTTWITQSDFKKYTLSNRPFQVTYLDHSVFSDLRDAPKTVRDTYLLFEALFYEKALLTNSR